MNTHEIAAPTEPCVLTQRDDRGIVRLLLNRPRQYNALSEEMLTALQAALDAAAADPAVRVVVLAGQGKAFCAGHDLKELRAQSSLDDHRRLFAHCARLMLTLQRMPQPVIARVHGLATAAGCQLVATCDLAVAAEEARFAVSGIAVGLFCSTPAVALTRNLSRKQAFEMLVTGDFIDARAAQDRGLVNRVVAASDLDAEVERLALAIAGKPALSIARGKELFYKQLEMGIDAAYQLAGQTMACNMLDADTQEGLDAFIGKRKPAWAR